jgi:ABC-type transport system involved in multi-copper enzyme maturation permease subunit
MTFSIPFASLPLGVGQQWQECLFTPLWIFSLGVALGAFVLALAWLGLAIVSMRSAMSVARFVREGALWPVSFVMLAFVVLAMVAWLAVTSPGEMIGSLSRMAIVGDKPYTFEIPSPLSGGAQGSSDSDAAGAESGDANTFAFPIEVAFNGRELERISFDSNQHLLVTVETDMLAAPPIDVMEDEPREWIKAESFINPFPDGPVEKLYVQNLGDGPATLHMTVTTAIAYPQMRIVPVTAVGVVLLYLAFILQNVFMPKISAVAHATYKSEIAQPLFWILTAIGIVGLVLSIYIPYFTLGEDIKMLKASSLSLILVLAIAQAVWASSNSIADEIEGKTALTVLSKPLGRRDFILGKFLGISWTVGLMFVILGGLCLATVAYKSIYDFRESSKDQEITWQICFQEMNGIVPGLALSLLETLLLAAISVAISTRLPLVANFSITAVVYVLGHLTPLIVQSSELRFTPVKFIGQLIAVIFPVLDHYNVEAAIAKNAAVPPAYLGAALLYTLIFGAIAMLLALLFFEDRDLT